ncbi:MAG: hypothetical protein INR71_12070 [Terriglobus roseus]|nr:hypothetical protein [Terriglobus roseus]
MMHGQHHDSRHVSNGEQQSVPAGPCQSLSLLLPRAVVNVNGALGIPELIQG